MSKGCPPERLETVPYNRHYKLAEKVDIVGTVPPNSPKSGAFGDRALQPRCSCPPLAGVQGVVAHLLCGALGDRALQPHCSCPPLEKSGTVGNRSLQQPLQTCGESGYCRDCCVVGTVPRTVRKAARSGTAPYSLVARRFSLLVAYLLKNGKPTSSRGRVSIYEGAMNRKAGK